MSGEGGVTRALLAARAFSDALDQMHGVVEVDMGVGGTDLSALRMLIESEQRGESVSPHQLAKHLRISTASTTKLLDRLTSAGHVRRVPHPGDRRARIVVLTAHARSSFFLHFGSYLSTMRGVAAGFDDDQLGVVSAFMERTAEALREAIAARA